MSKKITDSNFDECVQENLAWFQGHEKYGWAPHDLLELFAKAEIHYFQQMYAINSNGVPAYKVRDIKEHQEVVQDYSPSLGKLSRIAKRTKAFKKEYKRSQAEGYNEQTRGETQQLKSYLKLTLAWEIHPDRVQSINEKLDRERQLWVKKKAEMKRSARRAKQKAKANELIGEQIRKTAGDQTFGWDLAKVGSIFYTPIKREKISFADVPVALQTAAILRDHAGDVLPDTTTQLIESAIVITGEGHQKMLKKIQKGLMIDSDLFKAARFKLVTQAFQKAGFIK